MARKWWTLTAVVLATFMLLLDITVVNTALPKTRESLGASFTDLQWVIDAYSLALATVVLTAGCARRPLRAQALVPLRPVRLLGRSLACGLAPTPAS